MGGKGSGRLTKEETILRENGVFGSVNPNLAIPQNEALVLPNYSGVKSQNVKTNYQNNVWINQTGQVRPPLEINTHYIANSSNQISLTLPDTIVQGDEIVVAGFGSGGWKINCGDGQTIHDPSGDTGVGDDGNITSSNRYDAIRLVADSTTDWSVLWKNGSPSINDTSWSLTHSLTLDGVNEYAYADDDPTLDITDVITVACWVKFTTTQSNKVLVGKWGTTDESYIMLVGGAGGIKNRCLFGIRDSNVSYQTITPGTTQFNDGDWHLFVGTYDGTNIIANVDNGTETSTLAHTGSIDSTAEQLTIGAYGTSPSGYYNGKICEVTIWNKAFDNTEINELYNSGVPAEPQSHSQSANLVGYWRCGTGDTIPTLLDKSSNSNDMTTVNVESADLTTDVPS